MPSALDFTDAEVAYFGVGSPVGLPMIFALEMGKVKYVVKKMDGETWGAMKASTPTKVLPVVTLTDGFKIVESGAILRAVGAATGALGDGRGHAMSEMLMGLNADMVKKVFPHVKTVFTSEWSDAKTAASKAASDEIVAHMQKYAQFLASADAFTASGTSVGELDTYGKLLNFSRAYPEMVVPALQPFMDRMAAVPEINAVVDGSSAWGPMPLYVTPFP